MLTPVKKFIYSNVKVRFVYISRVSKFNIFRQYSYAFRSKKSTSTSVNNNY